MVNSDTVIIATSPPQEPSVDNTTRYNMRRPGVQDEGSVASRECLAERTIDESVDTTSRPPRDQEEDDDYGGNDKSDNSSLESGSSSHDRGRCDICGENLEVCRHYRCQLDHCSWDCNCPKCRFCSDLISVCSCPKCALCDNKPPQCRCVFPRDRKICIDSSRRVFNIVRFAKPNDPWPDPVPQPQTVVLQGDMVAVITIGHPFPNWQETARYVKERILRKIVAAKQRLNNVFVLALARAVAKYKDRREWQKHVVKCRRTTLSESVTEADYKYVIEEAGL